MKQRKKERPAVRTFYNRLLRLPALILSITVLLGILPAAATDSVPKDYVTDGLILHLDAIDNEGTGTHSAEATGWVNLVNPGETLILGTMHGGRTIWTLTTILFCRIRSARLFAERRLLLNFCWRTSIPPRTPVRFAILWH